MYVMPNAVIYVAYALHFHSRFPPCRMQNHARCAATLFTGDPGGWRVARRRTRVGYAGGARRLGGGFIQPAPPPWWDHFVLPCRLHRMAFRLICLPAKWAWWFGDVAVAVPHGVDASAS
jgi:hypothetical protein